MAEGTGSHSPWAPSWDGIGLESAARYWRRGTEYKMLHVSSVWCPIETMSAIWHSEQGWAFGGHLHWCKA